MTLDSITTAIIDFVRDHEAWAGPIVAALAFCESLAVVSLFVPATVILVGIGALLGSAGLGPAHSQFWVICLSAAIGAALGDWVSFEVGRHFDERAKRIWPLNKRPDLVARAENFTQRFGAWGIFLGRFFGPVRALVPLVAGIFDMPRLRFQLANVASALIWAVGILAPGAGLLEWWRG
jgi:membrane protein DedA with SNARE-associated domain